MSANESGLLGNLPRSRPGTRSEKRSSERAQPSPATSHVKASDPPEADPVADAVRGVAKVAGAGLQVLDGATRHVLRRIPRL